jgi:Acetyl-CoA dehydrogenase C-terminal like
LESAPLLEIFGDVLLGWLHLWQAEIAAEKAEKLYSEAGAKKREDRASLVERNPEAAFLEGKISTARYYIGRLLPIVAGKVEALKQKETSPLDIPDAGF